MCMCRKNLMSDLLELLDYTKLLGEIRRGVPTKQLYGFTRLIGAFYLGLPLFKWHTTVPTLFEWPTTSEMIDAEGDDERSEIDRRWFSSKLPQELTVKFPAIMLWHMESYIEAIYYCSQFCDARSEIILRLIADHLFHLELISEYCTTNYLDMTTEKTIIEKCQNGITEHLSNWHLLIVSLLELDAVLGTTWRISFECRLLDEMRILQASLPLLVDKQQALPRPPIFLYQCNECFDSEHEIFQKLFVLIRIYSFLLNESNILHSLIDCCCSYLLTSEETEKDLQIPTELHKPNLDGFCHVNNFMRFILIIVTVLYRDTFSLEERLKKETAEIFAHRYKELLNLSKDEDPAASLKIWLADATPGELDQLMLLFETMRAVGPKYPQLGPFNSENSFNWAQFFYSQTKNMEDHQNAESGFLSHGSCSAIIGECFVKKYEIRPPTAVQADFFYRHWTPPNAINIGSIPITLKISPSDLVSLTFVFETSHMQPKETGINFRGTYHIPNSSCKPSLECDRRIMFPSSSRFLSRNSSNFIPTDIYKSEQSRNTYQNIPNVRNHGHLVRNTTTEANLESLVDSEVPGAFAGERDVLGQHIGFLTQKRREILRCISPIVRTRNPPEKQGSADSMTDFGGHRENGEKKEEPRNIADYGTICTSIIENDLKQTEYEKELEDFSATLEANPQSAKPSVRSRNGTDTHLMPKTPDQISIEPMDFSSVHPQSNFPTPNYEAKIDSRSTKNHRLEYGVSIEHLPSWLHLPEDNTLQQNDSLTFREERKQIAQKAGNMSEVPGTDRSGKRRTDNGASVNRNDSQNKICLKYEFVSTMNATQINRLLQLL